MPKSKKVKKVVKRKSKKLDGKRNIPRDDKPLPEKSLDIDFKANKLDLITPKYIEKIRNPNSITIKKWRRNRFNNMMKVKDFTYHRKIGAINEKEDIYTELNPYFPTLKGVDREALEKFMMNKYGPAIKSKYKNPEAMDQVLEYIDHIVMLDRQDQYTLCEQLGKKLDNQIRKNSGGKANMQSLSTYFITSPRGGHEVLGIFSYANDLSKHQIPSDWDKNFEKGEQWLSYQMGRMPKGEKVKDIVIVDDVTASFQQTEDMIKILKKRMPDTRIYVVTLAGRKLKTMKEEYPSIYNSTIKPNLDVFEHNYFYGVETLGINAFNRMKNDLEEYNNIRSSATNKIKTWRGLLREHQQKLTNLKIPKHPKAKIKKLEKEMSKLWKSGVGYKEAVRQNPKLETINDERVNLIGLLEQRIRLENDVKDYKSLISEYSTKLKHFKERSKKAKDKLKEGIITVSFAHSIADGSSDIILTELNEIATDNKTSRTIIGKKHYRGK